ncbi:MAG: 16S rRNA (cytosine(1402)-N(4))-methyltransferase, partial [Pyrinomonadaceae bacterium]|nr:16S rRNA (cytosine(1402)-N(4))-methyltransferase [Pyrinomonadaceae bacterium]
MAAPLGGKGAPHRPVLLEETMQFLAPERGGLFVDCTVGLGGHTEAILQISSEARVIGIDLDKEALDYASKRLERFGKRFRPVQANFREISAIVTEAGEKQVQGVLADLGVSSLQFDSATRGFSFRFDAPLDMRMNPSSDMETA